jgi:hypothetical protein
VQERYYVIERKKLNINDIKKTNKIRTNKYGKNGNHNHHHNRMHFITYTNI